ncbi:MAG: dienelactone hydrolase family protein [Anaerolineae bacterium]|nr:dienelactone hydrolase family protein [Anaerolineae bacterium]
MHETRHVQHPITSGYISIIADDHQLPAFWAHPQVRDEFPALVLIHESWGLTPHIRACVRRLAETGFYVIAPDLYDGQIATTAEEAAALAAQLGEAGVPRIGAALGVLEHHIHSNGKVGVVGWQMGGEIAFHMTIYRPDIRAAVIFYARPDQYLTMMRAEETPMLCLYGDSDPDIPMERLEQMRSMLAASPGKGEVVIYPQTSTGFFNETLPAYNAERATDAWNRMLEFLIKYLEPPRRTKLDAM